MAQVSSATLSPLANLTFKPIINDDLRPAPAAKPETFNPDKHLAFVNDPKRLTLQDLSLPEDVGISPFACSEPFPLFTQEAIQIMRQEIFTTETLAIISKIAGVDLIPNIQYEVGNINISIQNAVGDRKEVQAKSSDSNSVTKWHYDAFPFVCVVMMSDATNMVGGETALKTGTGEILKVRGPQMGSAVVLQGRYVEHQALAALGGTERITMITSFRPRDPCIKDDSVLTSIRPISEHSELYYQWVKYRVEVVQERMKVMLKDLEERHYAGSRTDIPAVKKLLAQQEEYINITNREIVEDREPLRAWERN
ncbi:hypothetical protein CH35J_003200 [Colletotrichum higginsianum]|uniref:Fe2OG dioxygenase domain-containing protein n=1 Tax=Colletotrichum higginsianum TaxID=80884 RepID=A0A4T0WFI0_9PEZI|nr:hypothetical protein CH35J_003200 [Colletotrichum higginsianum]